MKLILKRVKIMGFDSSICRTFVNNGKETKQYSVALYISEADKAEIDKYLYNKVEQNQEGEFIFYGKSKQPIPVFDADKKRITKPLNEVFLADVSILIDEFQEKNLDGSLKYNDDNSPSMVRYSKCLGIKYLQKVENEQPKMQQKVYEDFDDIFSDEEEINLPESDIKTETTASEVNPEYSVDGEPKELNDLPF